MKQTLRRKSGGVQGLTHSAHQPPPPTTTTTSTSSHMGCIVLWAHQRGVMTSLRQSQASHIIITAYCSKSNPCSAFTNTHARTHAHTQTRDRGRSQRPSHTLIHYSNDLLDISSVQIICVFNSVRKHFGTLSRKVKWWHLKKAESVDCLMRVAKQQDTHPPSRTVQHSLKALEVVKIKENYNAIN